MGNDEYLNKYEENLKQAITTFLLAKGEIDEILPDAPDIEEKWESIGQEYLPDGVREFNGFPTVSLGWVMFTGMAVAKLWDEDWERYGAMENLYALLRDVRGYDCMDEYICEEVLKLDAEKADTTSALVADVAQVAHRLLMHERFEAGSPTAFHAYIRSIRQLFLLGAAVQLKRMGYKMTRTDS